MVRAAAKLPGFCLNKIRPHVRIRSPTVQTDSSTTDLKNELSGDRGVENAEDAASKSVNGRKIMLVVESSLEARNALHWALTHTLQSRDLLYLLYVTKPSKQGERFSKDGHPVPRIPDFLHSMKTTCKLKRPEVETEIIVAEGKEKGPTVVEQAKKKEVAMLILGQKKRSMSWRLLMMWAGNRRIGGNGVVEHCIQNASCMAIAVRRKSKDGGYLITTKRHKNFWLLA
ncbi:hypothetical protein DCAR_0727237 [Daucus carota subsp. sativus]|uniref:Uncharacterized protein n=1 Tax=Daucus carota subsp. sativus TaxID=79200 RepID=A0A164STF3_DAUCS|nr:PREDICTED: uncharacterized protein LOC108195374 [Daucus carota subsp. sativus]WOH07803.1 hypothetical protein DCAR_0727237 [Daucus carota subsp. sativus]